MKDYAFLEEVLDEMKALDGDLYSLGKNKRLADSVGTWQLQKFRRELSALWAGIIQQARKPDPLRDGVLVRLKDLRKFTTRFGRGPHHAALYLGADDEFRVVLYLGDDGELHFRNSAMDFKWVFDGKSIQPALKIAVGKEKPHEKGRSR